jgi:hypothetical protein
VVGAFLAARRAAAHVERWSDNLFEVLLSSRRSLEACDAYVRAWRDLVSFVLAEEEQPHVAVLRQYITMLDGDWESVASASGEDFSSVQLRPLHPFVLVPHIELVNYVKQAAGRTDLGKQAEWIRDRTVPAYPAVWTERSTLVYHHGSTRPVFARRGVRQRPEMQSRSGISDVLESYIGLHPFARESLTVLLIDPPSGNGIPAVLRALENSGRTKRLAVFVLHTDTDATDWHGLRELIDLGRVPDLSAWARDSVISANVTFVFQASRAAAASSHSGEYSPSRGLQNVLTVSVVAPPITAPVAQRQYRIPCVSVQPRQANDVVNDLMRLARATDREDRFFQVEPMLQPDDAAKLADLARLCDWLTVATPSPIGMIPPRRLPDDALVYLGRENSGPYGLFVYGRDLFPVRRHLESRLADAPLQPERGLLESQIEELALSVPNGVLRLGRGHGDVTEQVGLVAASALAREV